MAFYTMMMHVLPVVDDPISDLRGISKVGKEYDMYTQKVRLFLGPDDEYPEPASVDLERGKKLEPGFYGYRVRIIMSRYGRPGFDPFSVPDIRFLGTNRPVTYDDFIEQLSRVKEPVSGLKRKVVRVVETSKKSDKEDESEPDEAVAAPW
jgi:hypothetical protein